MPINPNIALGIQPVQQPNLLGQMGQIMAIRAAQEDLEGGADVRNYFAKPAGERGDPTPLLGSKRGQAAYKAFNEGQEKQLDIAKKNVELVGAAAGAVLQNPTLENFSSVLSNLVQNRIYTPDQAQKALAAIGNDPSKIPAFVKPIFDQAVSAEKRLTDMTSRRGQDLSYSSAMAGVGATMRGQDITDARLREQQAFERDKRSVIAGEGQFLQTDAYGNVYPVASYGATRGPNAPAEPLPPAAANAFVTTQPPVANALAPTQPTQPLVNALVQPGLPTVANALALEQQQGIPKPKTTIRQPVAVMKDGKAVLVPPEQAVGLPPASADAEKAARLQAQQVRDLGLAITNLESAIKPGGLITQSTGSGLGRAYDVAAGFVGQAPEGAIAAAKLAPIADMVLKMVPRFEGPQSDKDTQSYKEAAGQLANPNLPTKIRQEAGKEILRLMKERRDQFVSADMAREGFGAAPSGNARNFSPQEQQALEWANANASDPRAAQIKQRLGM